MTELVLLGGASGTGPTTVAYEVSRQLRLTEVEHALVDGDNLCHLVPQPPGTLTGATLRALWPVYGDVGCTRLSSVNSACTLSTCVWSTTAPWARGARRQAEPVSDC